MRTAQAFAGGPVAVAKSAEVVAIEHVQPRRMGSMARQGARRSHLVSVEDAFAKLVSRSASEEERAPAPTP